MTSRLDDIVGPSKEDREREKLNDKIERVRNKFKDAAQGKIKDFVRQYLMAAGVDDRSELGVIARFRHIGFDDFDDYHFPSFELRLRPILLGPGRKYHNYYDSGIYFAGSVSISAEAEAPADNPLNFNAKWQVQYRRSFPPKPPETESRNSFAESKEEEFMEIVRTYYRHVMGDTWKSEYPLVIGYRYNKDGLKERIMDATYIAEDNGVHRLLVVNHTIPATKNFAPKGNSWKMVAKALGPLDEEIYRLFHDRNRK